VLIVKAHDLKPGMILVKEIQNHSGRKLLPAGILITEKHILSLKAWGIAEAEVQTTATGLHSTPEAEQIDPEKLAKVNIEIEGLFRFSNQEHPAVLELMRLSSLNRLKKMPGLSHVQVK